MPTDITHEPPTSARCPKCNKGVDGPRDRISLGGVMMRTNLSRLEEAMGHEGFECDRCGYKLKFVPRKDPVSR